MGKKRSAKNLFLYKHEYRDQEMRGGRTRETIFQETQYSANIKSWEEKRWKKVRTRFLYIQTNIVNKKWRGNKRANQFFQKHTNSASKKLWEKITSEKIAKKRFIYSHEYLDQKMGGKKRPKQFFQIHTNSTIKICWEINRRKKCLNHF